MTIEGMPQLQRRVKAIGQTDAYLKVMALRVVSEAQRNAAPFRKTGDLQRSIVIGRLTKTDATVEARAPYALFVEKGTGIYGPRKRRITPKSAKALRWEGGGKSKVRLTGRSRTRGGRPIADVMFATSVKGRPATPFMEPAAQKVTKDTGIVAEIVKKWNEAA